jgi:hypothetical protein
LFFLSFLLPAIAHVRTPRLPRLVAALCGGGG